MTKVVIIIITVMT